MTCKNCNGFGKICVCQDGRNCTCAAMESGVACERAISVVCPVCKGVCGVETGPNDWHDCDNCDATGKVPA